MAKDLVCGMDVDEKTAKIKTKYQGQTYYFCALHCKEVFEKEPEKYLKKKRLFTRFLDWLSSDREKEHGKPPSCCGK
ncbi:MAG TPA: hypothetical protein DHV62_06855 [Elusimicrobia bacterium]|nr:hypothetical protein [Elusimicrobiota bacterium]